MIDDYIEDLDNYYDGEEDNTYPESIIYDYDTLKEFRFDIAYNLYKYLSEQELIKKTIYIDKEIYDHFKSSYPKFPKIIKSILFIAKELNMDKWWITIPDNVGKVKMSIWINKKVFDWIKKINGNNYNKALNSILRGFMYLDKQKKLYDANSISSDMF